MKSQRHTVPNTSQMYVHVCVMYKCVCVFFLLLLPNLSSSSVPRNRLLCTTTSGLPSSWLGSASGRHRRISRQERVSKYLSSSPLPPHPLLRFRQWLISSQPLVGSTLHASSPGLSDPEEVRVSQLQLACGCFTLPAPLEVVPA